MAMPTSATWSRSPRLTMADRPWEVGTETERWRGYRYPGTQVLRNVPGIKNQELLSRVEATLSSNALALYAPDPTSLTFDLDHLRDVHRHLFRDVYPWAGEIRTATMGRGVGPPFAAYDQIEDTMDGVARYVADAGRFEGASLPEFRRHSQAIYHVVNNTHPFREGNGRSQRRWLSDLAENVGFEVRWGDVPGQLNDRVSEAARRGDHEPMKMMFEGIVQSKTPPERASPPVLGASFPATRTEATRPTDQRPNAKPASRPTPEVERGYDRE